MTVIPHPESSAGRSAYGPLIARVLAAAFALSAAHTIYSEAAGIADPGFRVDSPTVWAFYAIGFGAVAVALRTERAVQVGLVAYLAALVGISVLYYPTTFIAERQTVFGWIENDVYVGLLMVAVTLCVLRLRGVELGAGTAPARGETTSGSADPRPADVAPIDVHDMVVVHRAFRRELRVVPELVRNVRSGDTRRAAVVASHVRLCVAGLHLHHSSEDQLLWPLLLERSTPAADLVHRMEDQHAEVEDGLEQIEPVLARWESEARPAVGAELAGIIDAVRAVLMTHLDEEERMILPLAACHLDQGEWAAIGEAGVAKMTRRQLPLMFGMVMEDASPAERHEMLRVLPAPVRLVLRTWGARHYARYVRTVRRG